jgi:predicted transcriptional regulator
MKVLLSIRPEYAELILSGHKRYEFRRVCFRNANVRSVLIYATLPIGKVVGEFDVREIISGSPLAVWKRTKDRAGLTWSMFAKYFAGKSIAHALAVSNIKRFSRPLDLSEILPSGVAPQSFCYVAT